MAKSTNQKIQSQLSTAGKSVSYKEAAAVSQKLGVSVDRVYNQTAATGQTAKAGAAAANAGYVPTQQLKVSNPITSRYVAQSAANAYAAGSAANPSTDGQGYAPEFDWQAWNDQMAQQQAAIWASMDAMNAQFMQQQQQWLSQQQELQKQPQGSRSFAGITTTSSADRAQVKRQKKSRTTSNTSIGNQSLGINGNQSTGTANLGAGKSGGVSLGG